MTIHKEGYTSIALCILFIAVVNAAIQFYYPEANTLRWIVYILSAMLFFIILQFFRSPVLALNAEETEVLCPADGKVVVIEETVETEYFKDKRIQVSVFMSPVNVHINRNPISGIVKYFKYHPGKYLVAWHPKSSTENERTTVVTENSEGVAVLFRQIAGALARRIVWYVKEGDLVQQGHQFGFIKFGSRVDIFLPLNAKINVSINEVVKGGRTVLAELPSVGKFVDIDDVPDDMEIPDFTQPSKAPLSDEHGEPTMIVEHEAKPRRASTRKAKTAPKEKFAKVKK
ncbi:phosphatidylserine decarboxylase family protein [Mucilaginibacter psychrotolerans]|uniref:Phosphatidylserine decarboxylase proenzyme n=1 Tax=Mucilaginibacter psychrotolerans TaxID=1524096 RepID=A0A4Y8SN97_9SPHI|nr:phosphatidylserine decarboxylase family protein [Mucilaginibacter psychrotolerans]